MVIQELNNLLSFLPEKASFNDLIKEALNRVQPELPLKDDDIRQWSLLPSIICESVGGNFKQTLPACAAIQLLIAAGEVFDDIEDSDSSDSISARYGHAVATNVATTLLFLSEKAIVQLKIKGVSDQIIIRILDAVNSYYTKACAGQHLDLTLTPEMANSEDTYLKVAIMKSASTPECACHIGALLATENQELIDMFTLFGQNLGVASQIANDILGITRGNDIVRRKISLPIIYILNQTDGDVRNQVKLLYSNPYKPLLDTEQFKDLLFNSGAIHYTTIKMNLFKQQALDILTKAKGKGVNIEKLKPFLD